MNIGNQLNLRDESWKLTINWFPLTFLHAPRYDYKFIRMAPEVMVRFTEKIFIHSANMKPLMRAATLILTRDDFDFLFCLIFVLLLFRCKMVMMLQLIFGHWV